MRLQLTSAVRSTIARELSAWQSGMLLCCTHAVLCTMMEQHMQCLCMPLKVLCASGPILYCLVYFSSIGTGIVTRDMLYSSSFACSPRFELTIMLLLFCKRTVFTSAVLGVQL